MRSPVHSMLVTLGFGVLCGSVVDATAAAPPKNEEAIQKVLAGQYKVAQAAWWGFDPVESTAALQAAIDSGAEKVVVEKMLGPWIVDKIQLAGNQEVFFEPGVIVLAKKDAFRGKADALFTAQAKENVKLTGHGATLRMHRDDYDSPAYTKAEWRHVLNLRGCTNVTVEGLTLAESGGDGIYLGTGPGGTTNRNIAIRDVVCDRNYRQGISVITAENLLIENCVLKNTSGTAPAAGIDFEPNRARERLVNCVMRKCTIENNQGYALHVYAAHLDGTSVPVSIRLEDCVTRGTNARSVNILTGCGPTGPVKGQIELVNCRFEDVGKTGIRIGSKPPGGVHVRLVGCTLADPAEKPLLDAPILFTSRKTDLQDTGGVEFVDCTIRERANRPVMKCDNFNGVRLQDVTGRIVVERDGQRTEHTLDQKLIDEWVPYDPVVEIPIVDIADLRFEPVGLRKRPGERKLPHHRLRGDAIYLVYAAKGETVSLRLKHSPVGRGAGEPLAAVVLSPTGKEVGRVLVPLGEEMPCTFTAAQPGTFRIACEPQRNTVEVTTSSHPICIAGTRGGIQLLATTGDFYFWVPAAVRDFGLRLHGQGEAERISATVFDGTGQKRWQQTDIAAMVSFCHRHAGAARDNASAPGEIWRLHLDRPNAGILEDGYVELRGVPTVLGFNPNDVLRPMD